MGIDTRFFGPSGWQLFHLISFRPHAAPVLALMKDVLPCKFCRASTTEFVEKHPLQGDAAKWLYEIHNMVNDKLRTQCAKDPAVPNPGEDPSFEHVKETYEGLLSHKPTAVPGRDFLFAIARNYPEDPEEVPAWSALQTDFITKLSRVYPFEASTFQTYLRTHPVDLRSRTHYMRWMYGVLKTISKKLHVGIPSFRGYAHHVSYYKSGCAKKTYHGKTCRNGTKVRDHGKTKRIVHNRLLL